ncbi:hypothetical protein HK097_010237 [Rhizophlyctis rosea]|uniref:cellulose 1,4-beta-cellobiosidase (non-reducing end) n=1 Tax=Rhizophlyctis rosea TaxID=64517 RepID=A0AAD5S7U7_9FUNG|nr:hypothetical protein HK097_010237 [Rhizophlyctis rosea]
MHKSATLLALSGFAMMAKAQTDFSKYILPISLQNCATANGCVATNTGIIVDASGTGTQTGAKYTLPSDAAISSINNGAGLSFTKPISRSYLVNRNSQKYELLNFKNRAFSFDVNLGAVGCGYNAALYMSQMPGNSQIGLGYCDAQNTCNEMDILEGNIGSQAVTPHPCAGVNNTGACDPWGCTVNTYNTFASSVGPGKTIDTTKTYTITTEFHTADGTDSSEITYIQQILTQGSNKVVLTKQDDSMCSSEQYWRPTNGYTTFSKAYDIGMVLIFSFWGGPGTDMSWLDSGSSNPNCNKVVGSSNSWSVTNMKISYLSGTNPTKTTTTTTTTKTTTTTTTRGQTTNGPCNTVTVQGPASYVTVTPPAVTVTVTNGQQQQTTTTRATTQQQQTTTTRAPTGGASLYGQCGGQGWTGMYS